MITRREGNKGRREEGVGAARACLWSGIEALGLLDLPGHVSQLHHLVPGFHKALRELRLDVAFLLWTMV